jgi:hypothetical protein
MNRGENKFFFVIRKKRTREKKNKRKDQFSFTSHLQHALCILIINRIGYDLKQDKRKKTVFFFFSSMVSFAAYTSLPLLIPDARH